MLPLLYETTNRDISINSMNYLGRITQCKNCVATEERNGDYLLNVEIAISDNLARLISPQQFIKVKSNPFDEAQFFEIYEVKMNTNNTFEVKAKHIKHCCYNNIIEAGEAESYNNTPQAVWDRCADFFIFENHFSFHSDITEKANIENGYVFVSTIGELFEEMSNKYPGEYYWDNFNVHFLKNRGTKKEYVLQWGKNISSVEQTISTESIKSHVIAVATVHDVYTDTDIQLVAEPYEIQGNQSKTNKLLLFDASWLVSDVNVNSHTAENYDFVKNACRIEAALHYKNSNLGSKEVNIVIDFRPQLDEMREVGLCDTVNVILNDKGDIASAKVIKCEYDCILERWKSLELGTLKTRLSDLIIRR